MARLRNYFLTGFIVTAPLAITVYLAWSFVGWVDSWVKPYLPSRYNPDSYLPFAVPGFGLIIALLLITLVGFLTANIIGRTDFIHALVIGLMVWICAWLRVPEFGQLVPVRKAAVRKPERPFET